MTLLDGARRVLFCHAHPDDETLSTGALIAQLTSTGVACDVLTSSRGEQGEVVPAVAAAIGSGDLEEHRAGELAGALQVLGVARHAFMGTPPARAEGLAPRVYRDSGMAWIRPGLAGPADASDERSFTFAPVDEQVADLVALLDAWRPDAVVSYDAGGGYGHPDHVRMHHVARLAAAERGLDFVEIRHHQGPGVEWHEHPETLQQVAEALRHHASQLTVQPGGDEVVHVGGQREAILTSYGLARG